MMRKNEMQIVIEKGVPIPPAAIGRKTKGQLRLSLEAMEVGDSFVLHGKGISLNGAVYNIGKAIGRKFTTRKIGNDVRVWRIK